MRLLDVCSGQFGWSRAFAIRGWECVGIDLVPPADLPEGCSWWERDLFSLDSDFVRGFDFAVASTPCEQFSVHGMKHFHPNPSYPELGIRQFNHVRSIFEASGVPYVMENVRAAQQFLGKAVSHAGSFFLWGSGVPPLLPQGITKGIALGGRATGWKHMTAEQKREIRKTDFMVQRTSGSKERLECTAKAATIPYELASCVADYALRLTESIPNFGLELRPGG